MIENAKSVLKRARFSDESIEEEKFFQTRSRTRCSNLRIRQIHQRDESLDSRSDRPLKDENLSIF